MQDQALPDLEKNIRLKRDMMTIATDLVRAFPSNIVGADALKTVQVFVQNELLTEQIGFLQGLSEAAARDSTAASGAGRRKAQARKRKSANAELAVEEEMDERHKRGRVASPSPLADWDAIVGRPPQFTAPKLLPTQSSRRRVPLSQAAKKLVMGCFCLQSRSLQDITGIFSISPMIRSSNFQVLTPVSVSREALFTCTYPDMFSLLPSGKS